ncbi:MAG TPA: head GIN domain-containing protein [Bacteroidia bacterium]|nr:head GIN domain-containing protein [Bacteroidia bacterium]
MAALCLLASGCRVFCTEGEGTVRTETREPGGFQKVALNISANIKVVKAEKSSVEISAQENLLEKIRTRVSGTELIVSSEGCISSDEKILVTVYLAELEGLEINGSGNISVPDTFLVDKIKLDINGSGDISGKFIAAKIAAEINGSGNITLAGSADKQNIEIHGSGNINSQSLICNEATIDVAGSGDVRVYAIKNLDVDVAGSGSVYYKGKPTINSHIAGSGKVVDEN